MSDYPTDEQIAEWREKATRGYQPPGNRAVWAQRCVTLADALTETRDRLAEVEDELASTLADPAYAARNVRRAEKAEAEIAALRAQVEGLADWHERQAEKALRIRVPMEGHDDAARRLRHVLATSGDTLAEGGESDE